MKASIWYLLLASLACLGVTSFPATRSYGQAAADPRTSTSDSGSDGRQTADVCATFPCKSAPTGRKSAAPPPGPKRFTAAELEESRYSFVFAELGGQEQAARNEDAAGHAKAAASWRGYLAAKSGLTADEAEIVKKIGAKYLQDWWAFQSKEREQLLAIRRANPGVRMSRYNSPEIAALEQERKSIFENAKAELVAELGQKSFTRLDSYILHRYDNARILSQTGQQRNEASTPDEARQ